LVGLGKKKWNHGIPVGDVKREHLANGSRALRVKEKKRAGSGWKKRRKGLGPEKKKNWESGGESQRRGKKEGGKKKG